MNLDLRLTQLIERHFDGALDESEAAELNRTLRNSAAARTEFWEFARLHNLLHEAEKLNAGSEVGQTFLSASSRQTGMSAPPVHWKKWSFSAAALFALGLAIYIAAQTFSRDQNSETVYVAQLRHSENAEWLGASQPTDGEHLARGPLELDTGLAELVFFGGAVVAIEGPAKIELLSPTRMRLHRGNLSADVPERAIGFTVDTPDSKVVDLGTRFGVSVDRKGLSETHVFEGKVTVEPGKKIDGAGKPQQLKEKSALVIDPQKKSIAKRNSDSTRFPAPERVLKLPLKDGEFDPATHIGTSGIAGSPGLWSGDYCSVAGEEQDVKPRSGSGMLRFQLTFNSTQSESRRSSLCSDQFQIVDLTEHIKEIEKGGCFIDISGWFRCAVGNAESNNRFGLGVYAFKGAPDEARSLWATKEDDALAGSLKEIPAEQAEKRWQYVRTTMQLPSNATLLLVNIYAKHLMASSDASEEFPGHYADSIELKLRIAPQAGSKN